ncbi:hypothetical protein [Evansella cellulosilytica]|uniref:Uncharacterized protein n=1 Tax=Evansella cellulosilytica (strain ATCC 21833 / DSM 2522 / FERM P-1141 / JCM 9156 / N-4) TaxID=649639 RepID=E6U177_EVAC2|nr:hypothetical protein [Evansella cellulosilytica]ADU31523.1 hypothetical protein Bcell_3281 [Evansella cellulosilytica DSM 2522]
MDKDLSSVLVDFQEVKADKQSRLIHAFIELYSALFSYIEQEANIREKVRAKALFSKQTEITFESITKNKSVAPHFEHWFAFDYITIIGSRIFDLYLREQKHTLTKEMLEISSFMLLMYLHPVKLISKNDKSLQYIDIFQGNKIDAETFLFELRAEEGDIIFLRCLQVGFQKMIIGPSFIIDKQWKEVVMNELMTINDLEEGAIRKYLKENGMKYYKYRKRAKL